MPNCTSSLIASQSRNPRHRIAMPVVWLNRTRPNPRHTWPPNCPTYFLPIPKYRKTTTLTGVYRLLLLVLSVGFCGCNPDSQNPADINLEAKHHNPLSGCVMCHVDVEDEYLHSKHHSVAKISCVACHGPSKGHVADENNEIKPEETFARQDIDRLCGRCHECPQKAGASPTETSSPDYKVCTDCHAAHSLARANVN